MGMQGKRGSESRIVRLRGGGGRQLARGLTGRGPALTDNVDGRNAGKCGAVRAHHAHHA